MADGRAAQDPDRLPWLADTRRPPRASYATPVLFWVFLAIVLVAGIAYWLGVKNVRPPDDFADVLGRSPAVISEQLPELATQDVSPVPPPAAQIQAPGLPDVSPVTKPALVPIPGVDRARPAEPEPAPEAQAEAAPQPQSPASEEPKDAAAAPQVGTGDAPVAVAADKPAAPAPPPRLQAWPADMSAGASGRVARVGTFYSRQQAKQGWARIVRVYPGIRKLRAVVVPIQSLRNGQTYYRLQFGTTSQAHSTVLCQRMRVVGQSCVTVGLPGGGVGR